MGFSESISLIKACVALLTKEKKLLFFPLMSFIALIAVFISFIVPAFFIPRSSSAGFYILLFFFYVASYFVIIFFNTALIACAHKSLNGGKPTIGYGLSMASKNLVKILIWSVISATIGLILREISERSELFGKIVVALVGGAWSLLTFFVLPVMIFENVSVFASIKKSGSLLKTTWGDNAIGSISFGLFFLLVGLLGLIPLALSYFLFPQYLLLVLAGVVLYWIALGIISSAINGIFVAALYSYATTGKIPSVIDAKTAKGAFTKR